MEFFQSTKTRLILLILITVTFVLTTPLCIAQAPTATKTVVVTLDSVTLEYNDHVGNEWYYSATVNKKEMNEGDTITLKLSTGSSITLFARSIEDDKYPDIGQKTLKIPVSKLKAGKSNEYSVQVLVRENKGRYSGNTAKWTFNFSITVN